MKKFTFYDKCMRKGMIRKVLKHQKQIDGIEEEIQLVKGDSLIGNV